jgi:hypothetical protein
MGMKSRQPEPLTGVGSERHFLGGLYSRLGMANRVLSDLPAPQISCRAVSACHSIVGAAEDCNSNASAPGTSSSV